MNGETIKEARGVAARGMANRCRWSFVPGMRRAIAPRRKAIDGFLNVGAECDQERRHQLIPKMMEVRGWTSRDSLGAAVRELEANGR